MRSLDPGEFCKLLGMCLPIHSHYLFHLKRPSLLGLNSVGRLEISTAMTVLASVLRNVLWKAIVGGLNGAFSPCCEIQGD